MKLNNEELFPRLYKFKDLEAQRCPVPFHYDGSKIRLTEFAALLPFEL